MKRPTKFVGVIGFLMLLFLAALLLIPQMGKKNSIQVETGKALRGDIYVNGKLGDLPAFGAPGT